MDNNLLIMSITLLLTTVALAITPFITRRTENFGISIPESMYDRADFSKMRKKYAIILVITGFLICVLMMVGYFYFNAKVFYFLMVAAILLILFCGFGLYLNFHFKMKKLKETEDWQAGKQQSVVVDMTFRNEKLIFSNWWFVLPGMIIAATIAITFLLYDQIPDQIPMHTDFEGNVRYDPKSISNLLFLPGTQVFLLLLFLIINVIIKKSKQQVSAEHPEKSKQQNVLFRRRWSAFTIVGALLLTLMFSYMQLGFIYPKLTIYEDTVLAIFVGIILIGTIILAIKTGQGGSRIKMDTSQISNNVNRDDDRYWKLGQFYVNRNDPAIFVEKRFGVGWTNNWAHPLSWLFIIAIIAVPLIIVWIIY